MLVLRFAFAAFRRRYQFIEILLYPKLIYFDFIHLCLLIDFLCIIIFIEELLSKIITPVKLIKSIFLEQYSYRIFCNRFLIVHLDYQMGIIPNFVQKGSASM